MNKQTRTFHFILMKHEASDTGSQEGHQGKLHQKHTEDNGKDNRRNLIIRKDMMKVSRTVLKKTNPTCAVVVKNKTPNEAR